MTTLAPGQLIVQTSNGRIWRIIEESAPYEGGERRWLLSLIETVHNDRRRQPGDRTTASDAWLQRNCEDWTPPMIDPPCGDGRQTMVLIDGVDVISHAMFDTVDAMLQWTAESFAVIDNPHMRGCWYGWEHDPESDDPAEMTVTIVDGELVWAEA